MGNPHELVASFLKQLQNFYDFCTADLDYLVTFDFQPILCSQQLQQTIEFILRQPDLNEKLEKLVKGETNRADRYGYRFAKNPNLPRTVAIIFDGIMLRCIIMTNSKYESDDKYVAGSFLGKGTSKTVKICVEIRGTGIEFLARQQHEFGSDPFARHDLIEVIERELSFSAKHRGSKYILAQYAGPIYEHKKNDQYTYAMYSFSELGLCDLSHITEQKLNGEPMYLQPEEFTEVTQDLHQKRIPKLYLKLIKDITKGLSEIHNKGDIHGDIKNQNILIFRKPGSRLCAKIIDFGLSSSALEKYHPSATYTFASPQVLQGNPEKNRFSNLYETFFENSKSFNSYGQQVLSTFTIDQAFIEQPLYADAKDDIWALGVIILYLVCGHNVMHARDQLMMYNSIRAVRHNNSFVDALLAPTREDRPSAIEAKNMLNNLLKPL